MPRHPPYALTYLITIFILIWLRFFKILTSYCDYNKTITLSSFQRTILFERIFYLRSLKTKQNVLVASFFQNFRFFLFLHRKEVIHPHVLVGIPCYDFTPITCPTLNGPLPKRVRLPHSGITDFRGVTAGVYNTRERIHPNILIWDY